MTPLIERLKKRRLNVWNNDGVPFAIDANGKFRDVDDVSRGLECACFCADCKGRVVAKKGEIKAHHFAHHDRRDCRHALEASLFGMLMTMAAEPAAALSLPPYGDRDQLVPRPSDIFTDAQAKTFFRTPWVIESRITLLAGAELAAPEIELSSITRPDVRLPDLDVHVLSYKKREQDVQQRLRRDGPAVLVLDLREYASLWWTVCDENKNKRIQAAQTATNVMRNWLNQSNGGRTWLFHPDFENKKRELEKWIAEKSEVGVEKRAREKQAYVPRGLDVERQEPTASASKDQLAKSGAIQPVAFWRRVKNPFWLTDHMAANLGLWWNSKVNAYVLFGSLGAPIPKDAQDLIEANEPWQPVSGVDSSAFISAKEKMRLTAERYSMRRDADKNQK